MTKRLGHHSPLCVLCLLHSSEKPLVKKKPYNFVCVCFLTFNITQLMKDSMLHHNSRILKILPFLMLSCMHSVATFK